MHINVLKFTMKILRHVSIETRDLAMAVTLGRSTLNLTKDNSVVLGLGQGVKSAEGSLPNARLRTAS